MSARQQAQLEKEMATTVGTFEMFTKGVMGAAGGYVGVQILNAVSPGFRGALIVVAPHDIPPCDVLRRVHESCAYPFNFFLIVQLYFVLVGPALPASPIKAALVTMCAIGSGAYFSEAKVSGMAQRSSARFEHVEREHSTLVDMFHDHKVKAVGVLWATCIGASLLKGDMRLPFYQRLIDARIFAQWMTVGSAIGLGVLMVAFPDTRSKWSRFSADSLDVKGEREILRSYEAQQAAGARSKAAREARALQKATEAAQQAPVAAGVVVDAASAGALAAARPL